MYLIRDKQRCLLRLRTQTSNFFAALDDSGDEAPPKTTATTATTKKKKPAKEVAEPSKLDDRYVDCFVDVDVALPREKSGLHCIRNTRSIQNTHSLVWIN